MPVWGIDDITFEGTDPATWTDADRTEASRGHILLDPLEGVPILDQRRFDFNRRLIMGKDAIVLHPLDDQSTYHVSVADRPARDGQATTRLAVFHLPSLDHAIAYCNDHGLHIAKVVNLSVIGSFLEWPSSSDHDE